MDSNNFFVPGNSLYGEPEQVKRQKAALRLNVQSVDQASSSGKINDYSVTLDDCSCRDFAIHHKPCKHMYRLAHELGVFHLSGEVINDSSMKSVAASTLDKEAVISAASSLSEESKDVLYHVMYSYLYHSKKPVAFESSKLSPDILAGGLVSPVECDFGALADHVRKSDLSALVKEHGCKIKLTKKLTILEELRSNYPDLFQSIVDNLVFLIPSPSVLAAPRKVYKIVMPPPTDISWLWK